MAKKYRARAVKDTIVRMRKSSLEGSTGVARLQPAVKQGHVAEREAHVMG